MLPTLVLAAVTAVSVPGGADRFLEISSGGERLSLSAPVFELEGREVVASLVNVRRESVRPVADRVSESTYSGDLADAAAPKGARLEVVCRVADDSPVVRFRYVLRAGGAAFRMTKTGGRDRLAYLTADLAAWPRRTEVRLGEYFELAHTYRLSEVPVRDSAFENAIPFAGPIAVAEGAASSAILAYEHGSQSNQRFVEFRPAPPSKLSVAACAGSYWHGRIVAGDAPYETIWLQAAVVKGGLAEASSAYRDFALRRFAADPATRAPLVFYNTWGAQERSRWWRRRDYYAMINEREILADIDLAHESGVDVYVCDVGWFVKTGDWRVDTARFPNGLRALRERTERHGMRLGLWFSPLHAGVTSDAAREHPGLRQTCRGRVPAPAKVWHSEESYRMCFSSDWWKVFADRLIEIGRAEGVSYFKLDAIDLYGCDAAGHGHGDADTPEDERLKCCAFDQCRCLAKMAERVSAALPGSICDFDVTEPGRGVGLAFLSAGKFFVSNNGPYYSNLDLPYDWANPTFWCNPLVRPGAARTWFMRVAADYDKWLPGTLFMCHYLPDLPRSSQLVNLGSIVLGQGGIYGEFSEAGAEGRKLFRDCFAAYRQVREAALGVQPVRVGRVGDDFEVHEKLSGDGAGFVVMFSNSPGEKSYVTERRAGRVLWTGGDVAVTTDARGRAVLRASFDGRGAVLAFFK